MKKILLIEDNLEVRENTAEILELADYSVYTAENGKLGVELAKVELPDLIICDIMMPELDGYGVLRILTKNPMTSTIPFIFLTAKSDKTDIRKGMNLGADDYLTKPFEETELLEAVEIRLKRSEHLKREFNPSIEGLNQFMQEASGLEELESLSKDRKIRSYSKKEVIYREGDYANYLYFIVSGKVKSMKTDSFGKEFINETYGPGEFLGFTSLLSGDEFIETATAMEETEVAIIPKEDFLTLIHKNRDVSTKFIKMLSGNVKDREKRLLQLAYAPVRERVADVLLGLKLKEPTKGEHKTKLSISREDLANLVGTAKESLIRMLSELKKEELIDTDGQEITILDEAGLKKIVSGL